MAKIIKVTEDMLYDGTLGACRECGEIQEGCEPDARGYECEECGKKSVYGLEELLVMGEIEVVDGDEDSEEVDNDE